ncbi:RecQ family ATP-dependent DNA helicase [Tunturiibacter gelidoferens]|uniref:ATP-dependent DNA helicase RecQ n=1 Tax=Tunturiibacter gelidiferens TaxID=3069689 RepID=A0A9X0QIQ8_9BACT|nr:RecQ family ATP-dependent DNA helicase [Edaphobacter lichenicola]MBB5330973.1 ATP-dependent DNA helicase RecQ [Edaphobacter lichenicola]
MNLETLLHQTFGFAEFRANQEAVCRAATDGRDVLLVMPTGAGKSLCYQLPAIARGGTALVISPLIALMDDQATKLTAAGLRVARIHSGLSRDEARQACRDYLDGTLQFLFIAPERMRVPNFPEMLARRKPSLIAIDEAHCISAWGHDFRPDYRTLGDFLPALRPAPVIALTATATPTVQRDIITQLKLTQPDLFIHGFRRHNLAIEVVELSKPRRNEFTANLLKEKSNRPAIVYAPSRKAAEELASTLGGSAAAYHAGLDPATRERVQRHFLSGNLEVVVATIAFGMGIDKADVRTVVHTALPGSVEQYYQEIGRAGRDGKPSRTVLLHSFADRKMHDFFLERDYPAITDLTRVAALLTGDYQMPDLLRQRLQMEAETFDKAVEKLIAQGAANIDMGGNVRAAEDAPRSAAWRKGYDEQINFRRSQIDRMVQFAESAQCRMAALIQHFGDTDDGLRPCGHCDFCSPQSATAQTFRQPTTEEDRQLRAILRTLDGQTRATGKLHTELSTSALRNTPAADRKVFDTLLDALTRSGLITLITDQWTNPEGNVVTYKKAALTHEGRTLTGPLPPDLLLKESSQATTTSRKKSKPSNTTKPSKASLKAEREQTTAAYTPTQKSLEANLREWRKTEAAKSGKPAFMVFSDSVLHNLVIASPKTISQLLTVSGIGQEKADRLGANIIALCRAEAGKESGVIDSSNSRDIAPSRSITSAPKSSAPRISKEFSTQNHETQQHSKELSSRPEPERVKRVEREVERPPHFALSGATPSITETFHRQRATTPEPNESLTPDQQALDERLREWRKSESERLGLPLFFVLASTTLRNIVLARPQNLTQLKSVHGLGLDKIEKFGPGIIEVCTT